MTLDEVLALLATADLTRMQSILRRQLITNNDFRELKQYQPEFHEIFDKRKRPDKIIKNEQGQAQSTVRVARLPLAYQKKIVLFAAAFLGCPSIQSKPVGDAQENMVSAVSEVCDRNKMEYKFRQLVELVMSERHAAELWYTTEIDNGADYWADTPIVSDYRINVQILANSLGDELFPVFDEYNNLIAFGRGYQTREIVPGANTLQQIAHFDIYTAEEIYLSKKVNNAWLFSNGDEFVGDVTSIENPFGKIPVIYYWQPRVEWADVQHLIERMEVKLSNQADTNDYFDSPIIVATGDVEGFGNKGEAGKVLEAKNGATVNYLTWDNAPAAMKLEMDNLNYFISSMTHTPDISFENVKGLGKLSGIALKILFMDAHLKASQKEPVFAEGVQRRLNLLKAMLVDIAPTLKAGATVKLKPKFQYYMPEDVNAIITTINQSIEGGILSEETGISLNPLVSDPEQEQVQIEKEKLQNQANSLAIASAGGLAAAGAIPKPANPEPAYQGE